MALPNPLGALGDLITATLENYTGKPADNISKNNALLMLLQKQGNIETVDGGTEIIQEIEYQENQNYKRYTGYETIPTAANDTFTRAKFAFKQCAVSIVSSGIEGLQNAGQQKIFDLAQKRGKNAIKTMKNNLAGDVYSDGTADGGRQIGGLQLLVSKAPTSGTIGGIDRSAHSWWRNVAINFNTFLGGNPTSTNIIKAMNETYNSLIRGADHPNLIVADKNYFSLYQEYMQDKVRITSKEFDDVGLTNIKYQNSDVVLDGGYGGFAPVNTMYFLNTNYLHWRPHKMRNITPIGGDRQPVNQDAVIKLLGWAGNMTISNCFLQGVGYH